MTTGTGAGATVTKIEPVEQWYIISGVPVRIWQDNITKQWVATIEAVTTIIEVTERATIEGAAHWITVQNEGLFTFDANCANCGDLLSTDESAKRRRYVDCPLCGETTCPF